MSVQAPTVLFVDDDPDLCAVMADTFHRLGAVRCETRHSFAEIKAMGSAVHAFDIAVLDINLGPGQPNGVEIFYWLEDQEFKGRVVFLTGHAHDDPRVIMAAAITGTIVLSKPLKSEDLKRIITAGDR